MAYKLGVIGFGSRIGEIVKHLIASGECMLAAVADVDEAGARHRAGALIGEDALSGVHFWGDAAAMLDGERGALDGVCIGTRCSLHASLAAQVMEYEIPLFLEKPVATDRESLNALTAALMRHPGMDEKTVVSFPLRLTKEVQMVKEIVMSGKIGTVEHVQAVNDVPYGRVYYHDWYRDEKETGGLWLQKATHDFDYINSVLNLRPVEICAMTSKQVFKGNKPAGSLCDECEDKRTCPESYPNVKALGEYHYGKWCCFAEDTGNEDSGSAIIRYETGMHVAYSQNFFARRGAGLRGARFLGYRGTVEFDWQSREVRVYMHNDCRTESYRFDERDGHGGGDAELCRNFIEVMAGGVSRSMLRDGLLSVSMCLAAKESSETKRFVQIEA